MIRFQCLACASILIASAASAQNKPIPRAQYVQLVDNRFKTLDLNHDGRVTRDELETVRQRELQQGRANLTAKAQEAFRRLDTNKDGKLTLQEYMASVPEVRTAETADQNIQRYDSNHDGKISAEEFRAPQLAKFNKVDANHDGIVTPQEIQAANGK